MFKRVLKIGIFSCALGLASSRAQLAITEAFSSAAATNSLTASGDTGPDFWELTNFGTNTISLSGYRWNDAGATLDGDVDATVFDGVSIAPGESIVFVQNNTVINTRDLFTNWWGAANVPTNLQVHFYTGNGLSDSGDSVVLWNDTATNNADYLDRVDFGEATRGRTFTYNTNNGGFGTLSTNGVLVAFTAVTSEDEGSPGKTAGPVALGFTQQPTPASFTVPAGQNATFTVATKGLPRALYQWRFQGVPIAGATQAALTVTNAQTTNAGQYTVVIANGLTNLTSQAATLTVTVGPAAPTFTASPKNAEAFVNQTVQFAAAVSGSPTPALQWRSNNVDIAGETTATLTLYGVQSNQAAIYTLVATSMLGSNAAAATLTVTAKPRLLITEVQSTGSTGNQDWWELTSFETYPINLKGWRWDDSGPSLAPGNAVAFTNDVIIRPGESVVFVENYSAAQFRNWWTNLPADLQIVSYGGGGLGLSSGGDAVNLWNAVTLVGNELPERIAGVTFGSSPFLTTFVYDPENPPLGGAMVTFCTNTVNGTAANGMMTAANGAIGSPGRVIAPVRATNNLAGGNSVLRWNTANNRTNVVEYKSAITDANWNILTNQVGTGTSATFSEPATATQRLYRIGTTLPFVPQP